MYSGQVHFAGEGDQRRVGNAAPRLVRLGTLTQSGDRQRDRAYCAQAMSNALDAPAKLAPSECWDGGKQRRIVGTRFSIQLRNPANRTTTPSRQMRERDVCHIRALLSARRFYSYRNRGGMMIGIMKIRLLISATSDAGAPLLSIAVSTTVNVPNES